MSTMTLEQLKKGSDFHRVIPISRMAFEIWAADDSEECRQRFHIIVHSAIESAVEKGYHVLPHANPTDPKGRWGMAVITPAD
jgi:hypothetical protein